MADQRLLTTISLYEEIRDCKNLGEKGCIDVQPPNEKPCSSCLAKYDQIVPFADKYFEDLLGDVRLICQYYNFVLKFHAVCHEWQDDEDD